MQNYDKINGAYSSLSDILFDICMEANESSDYNQIDAALETADKISVILKRLGETAILEINGLAENSVDNIAIKKEEDDKK